MKRATNMLVCGEDLGFVPACVPDVMKQLLLDEGITFVDDYQVDLEKHLWVPAMEEEP